MSEASVRISSGGIVLEARYEIGSRPENVILCHPHPLYGGDMNNNVVMALRDAFRASDWGTLRFNFRGVGGSGGDYGSGNGEAEDLLAVRDYLLETGGNSPLHLAAYSFGAWVALKAVRKGFRPESLVLVSPPIDFLEFQDLELPLSPCLMTLGEEDEFCRTESLKKWVSSQVSDHQDTDLRFFPRCNHFYWGKESALSAEVIEFIRKRFE